MHRSSLSIIAASGLLAVIVYFLHGLLRPGELMNRFELGQPVSTMIVMRDGVRLHTRIWRPEGPGKFPVVLTRGYAAGNPKDAVRFNDGGYVYIGQATRGHGESEAPEGIGNRFFSDAEDGYDTLTWISEQSWSDGDIAMYGKSYWATTQWLVALEDHPNLKAIIPQHMNADMWQCVYWCNGALTLAMTANGRAYTQDDKEKIGRLGWQKYFSHRPLISLDEVIDTATSADARKLWRDYVSHSTFDDYWQAISLRSDGADSRYNKIRIPVYLMGGWYDYYAGAAFTSFQRLQDVGATDEIRVIINPSDHLNNVIGDRDYGSNAHKDEVALAIEWLDHTVRGVDNRLTNEAPIKIFVMGINQWRAEDQWPLATTQFTNYYLHSDNGSRFGVLSTDMPLGEPATRYVYDPEDPVPSLGGNHSVIDRDIADLIRAGAVDQTPNEARSDVLIFTSPPLDDDTEVTGPVLLKLYAASSAPDTDFIARLIDVYPDGRAFNLSEGIVRARFRESLWGPEKLLTPGQVYEYNLELLPTSNVFKKGNRIRVHITSSNFPLWNPNPNTGHRQGLDADVQIARQSIYHDAQYPSHIVLPIIPKVHETKADHR